jgi:hypothetical protein
MQVGALNENLLRDLVFRVLQTLFFPYVSSNCVKLYCMCFTDFATRFSYLKSQNTIIHQIGFSVIA